MKNIMITIVTIIFSMILPYIGFFVLGLLFLLIGGILCLTIIGISIGVLCIGAGIWFLTTTATMPLWIPIVSGIMGLIAGLSKIAKEGNKFIKMA